MSDPTTQAASSPAEQEDVFQGQQVSMAEYSHYRVSGELPERFKPAEQEESAPSATPEETVDETEAEEAESAPESEPEEAQEQPQKGKGAEQRIKQLLAKVKDLESRLPAKQDVKPESSPAQVPQTRQKPSAEDKKQDGSPKYSTYEEFVEDLADWKSEQQIARYKHEQSEQQKINALKTKLEDARARYDDADDVIFPTGEAINTAQIPEVVKRVVAESDVFADLLYVIGSDPDELKKLVKLAQTSPREALAKVFEYERGIKEELAKPEAEQKKAPEPKKTNAPKPPSPVSGGSSRAFDVSDESLSPDEWARKRTADLKKRGK